MLSAKDVSADVVAKADCVIVVPNFKKFGMGIGGSGGRGPMSCRTGDGSRGKWSPPAMYSIGGVSGGLQIGGSLRVGSGLYFEQDRGPSQKLSVR
jgi:lipid-binding SYLF domain-containing protein